MQKRILKQTFGQIPQQVGYNGFKGGFTMSKEKVIKEQKRNGLKPLNAVWDKKTKKYKVVYLSVIFALFLSSCFQGTSHRYFYVHPVCSDMVCLPN